MSAMYHMEATVAEPDFNLTQALIGQCMTQGWEELSLPTGEYLFRLHCPDQQILDDLEQELMAFLPEVKIQRTEFSAADWPNWNEAWKEFFTPVDAGEFLIIPPWLTDSAQFGTSAPSKTIIVIEPKSAFGTGHHASTVLCLEAISQLHAQGKITPGQRFLDLGTGTGILGIASAKLGLCGLGLDIDPLAISNALENRQINQVEQMLEVMPGSVETVAGEKFDLILANILANPLKEMAPAILNLLSPGGSLILSGLLDIQSQEVEAAYSVLGQTLRLYEKPGNSNNEPATNTWVCLCWSNVKTA